MIKSRAIKLYLSLILTIPLLAASCEEPVSVSRPDPPVSTGLLIIKSNPAGAKIFLNDKNTGRVTPDSIRWLENAVYKVALKMDLHKDTVFYTKAEEGKQNEVDIDYYANPVMLGSLLCNSEPQNADISINGSKTGQVTPYTFRNLKPGGYMISYKSLGCKDDSQYVVVKSSITSMSNVILQDTTIWLDFNMQNAPLPSNLLTCIVVDQNDVKWIGTDGKGLVRYDNRNWKTYTPENSNLPGYYINCLESESVVDGVNLWIGTNNGLAVLGTSAMIVYNTSNSPLPDNNITSVKVDVNGNKWIGTNNGLAVISRTKVWTVYTKKNSALTDSIITRIGLQYNKTWITSSSGAVMSIASGKFTNERSAGYQIKSLSVGYMFAGTWLGYYEKDRFSEHGGVLMYENGVWRELRGLPGLIPECIVLHDNERWIGTNNGLVQMEGQTIKNTFNKQNSGLPDNHIKDLAFDAKGVMWIATFESGLVRYKIK